MSVTLIPLDSRRAPNEAAAIPLPSDETTHQLQKQIWTQNTLNYLDIP